VTWRRWIRPRRIRSASPSRRTAKPPNATTVPSAPSSHASTTIPAATRTQPSVPSGSAPTIVRSPSIGSSKSCWDICATPAATGRSTPSWPEVAAATVSARPDSRLSGAAGASSAAAGRPSKARMRSTSAASTALSTISPPSPPPPVWTSTRWTPNSRWVGPCRTSTACTRANGTSISLTDSSPSRRRIVWSASE
jgi:hypothetical protein